MYGVYFYFYVIVIYNLKKKHSYVFQLDPTLKTHVHLTQTGYTVRKVVKSRRARARGTEAPRSRRRTWRARRYRPRAEPRRWARSPITRRPGTSHNRGQGLTLRACALYQSDFMDEIGFFLQLFFKFFNSFYFILKFVHYFPNFLLM